MKKKITNQLGAIREFEGYLKTLLNIIHGSDNMDYSVEIKKVN
jgi:hypothetical protein